MTEERLVTPDEMMEDESELSLRPERLNQYICLLYTSPEPTRPY